MKVFGQLDLFIDVRYFFAWELPRRSKYREAFVAR